MDQRRLERRVGNMLVSAVASSDIMDGGQHRLQVSVRADEVKSGLRVLTPYGFAARIVAGKGDAGAETVLAAVESDLRYALPPTDVRYLPDDLKPGESVVHDDQGQRVYLTRDGIDITSPKRIRILAPDIEVHASRSWLVNVGGYAEKLTHLSEGQLMREVWHEPAEVSAPDDHGYKHPDPG